MDGRIIKHNYGFSLQRLTKGIKASNHKVGIDTACRTKGDQIIVEIEKS